MLDHVFITVEDFDRSIAFYKEALKPLGIAHASDFDGKDGPEGHPDLKGFGRDGRIFFWLRQGDADAKAAAKAEGDAKATAARLEASAKVAAAKAEADANQPREGYGDLKKFAFHRAISCLSAARQPDSLRRRAIACTPK